MGELMQTPRSLGSGRPLGIDARWQRITTPRNESRGGGRDAPDGYACALSPTRASSDGDGGLERTSDLCAVLCGSWPTCQGWMFSRSSRRLGCVGSQPSAFRVWC